MLEMILIMHYQVSMCVLGRLVCLQGGLELELDKELGFETEHPTKRINQAGHTFGRQTAQSPGSCPVSPQADVIHGYSHGLSCPPGVCG